MQARLKLKITNPLLEEPIEHEMILNASTLNGMICQLKCDATQAYDLKKNKFTSFRDKHGSLHELSLHPMIEVIEMPTKENENDAHDSAS